MIPIFPAFKVVDRDDRDDVEGITSIYPPYSDFNFTSLWAWDTQGQRMISTLNDNLVVLFTDYATNEPFLSFLGTQSVDRTVRELLDYARAKGYPEGLRLVPEVSVIGIRDSALRIAEDRDNFDYVYLVSDHARLSGSDFKRSRNFVHKCKREHPNIRQELFSLSDAAIKRDVLSVIERWEEAKHERGKTSEIENESIAIRKLFTSHHERIIIGGIFEGNTMLGFSIDELLPDQYAISHFRKADTRCAGINDYIIHEKALHLETLDVMYMNFEQDLGVQGLRQSKLAYRPVDFLRKYIVTLVT